MWLGNNPGGDGNSDRRFDPEESAQERAIFVSLGEKGYMKMKTQDAFDFIRTCPRTFFALTVRRIGRLWGSEDQGASWADCGVLPVGLQRSRDRMPPLQKRSCLCDSSGNLPPSVLRHAC